MAHTQSFSLRYRPAHLSEPAAASRPGFHQEGGWCAILTPCRTLAGTWHLPSRGSWYKETFLMVGKFTSLLLGQKSSTHQSFLLCLASFLQCPARRSPHPLCLLPGFQDAVVYFSASLTQCSRWGFLTSPSSCQVLICSCLSPLLHSPFGNPPGPLHCCHLFLGANFWMFVSVPNSRLNFQPFTVHRTFCPVSPSIK